MIGSAYKGEDIRYCVTATEREKMIRAIYKAEGISEKKFIIVPVDDKPTFEEWLADVFMICEKYKVTHFCTGNQEDILDVLKQKGIPQILAVGRVLLFFWILAWLTAKGFERDQNFILYQWS